MLIGMTATNSRKEIPLTLGRLTLNFINHTMISLIQLPNVQATVCFSASSSQSVSQSVYSLLVAQQAEFPQQGTFYISGFSSCCFFIIFRKRFGDSFTYCSCNSSYSDSVRFHLSLQTRKAGCVTIYSTSLHCFSKAEIQFFLSFATATTLHPHFFLSATAGLFLMKHIQRFLCHFFKILFSGVRPGLAFYQITSCSLADDSTYHSRARQRETFSRRTSQCAHRTNFFIAELLPFCVKTTIFKTHFASSLQTVLYLPFTSFPASILLLYISITVLQSVRPPFVFDASNHHCRAMLPIYSSADSWLMLPIILPCSIFEKSNLLPPVR